MPILKKNADFVSERKKETMVGQMDMLKKEVAGMQNTTVRISREEFDLLPTTYSNTIYYITETDGSVSIREGEF